MSLEGIKVVAAHEMAELEKQAYAQGASDAEFMENAGSGVADAVFRFAEYKKLSRKVIVLVGKGNNGGDALVAARKLLQGGFAVACYQLYAADSCSPLCQAQLRQFQSIGGKVHVLKDADEIDFLKGSLILDGIVGTGFKGRAEGIMAEVIDAANLSGLPILAIDIPSGLNGDTGAVESVALHATQTFYLGLPKIGFFIGEGWNYVGELLGIDFGLNPKLIESQPAIAYVLEDAALAALLPPVTRTRHKYQKGYVLAVAGSVGMGGAAILSCFAALRSGAGIVRLFYPEEMEDEFGNAPLEVIKESWDFQNFARVFNECKRAKAMLIGPGLGREHEAEKMLRRLLANLTIPCVIDADALYHLSEHSDWELPEKTILTPHHKEMERLLRKEVAKDPSEFHFQCQRFAEKKNVVIVLKGGPTFIFAPKTLPLIASHGSPALATAGTGDVLTGVIAALLAEGLELRDAAALGVSLHGLAGEIAAAEKTDYCVVASDVIESLPQAFSTLLSFQ